MTVCESGFKSHPSNNPYQRLSVMPLLKIRFRLGWELANNASISAINYLELFKFKYLLSYLGQRHYLISSASLNERFFLNFPCGGCDHVITSVLCRTPFCICWQKPSYPQMGMGPSTDSPVLGQELSLMQFAM